MCSGEDTLSDMEAYDLIKEAVSYYWRVKFSFLGEDGTDKEDVVNEIFLSLYNNNNFEKYDSNKSSKKTYISMMVKYRMIDMVRKNKFKDSLDNLEINGEKIINCLEDDKVIDSDYVILCDVINNLKSDGYQYFSNNYEIWGDTPIGRERLSEKTITLLLALGYDVSEISEMFDESPWGDTGITEPTIYKIRNNVKDSFNRLGYSLT